MWLNFNMWQVPTDIDVSDMSDIIMKLEIGSLGLRSLRETTDSGVAHTSYA